ncbi:assimilatory sulfite reductase (NADPH) flavoprotein subunit [Paenibacillus sp. alder61]|uniref:assimilatory sulfite reductase (NADPH) n=1 Tax=Paenibacillus faecis TaxID=862114 RepID=A0A5D0CK87_9BACL|nr:MULTISPECIES: assimilatory sulfite reductase (NADPH) flavoprotein subunit [Paenibacillus]MCA1295509.1 assimilatory sulfite reductase (NADPH) flavoprotein subunit [Paenibacillus sp. alder61]TYA10399.1 assimilatory sulfite reductase (NADPH) flavoprotein subunit [Paenibacillus faecis]
MELQVTNSPFNQEQAELLNRLLPTLSELQRLWLSGYLTALHGGAATVPVGTGIQQAGGAAVSAQPVPVKAITKEVTVLFGSQTGNSNGLAKKLAKLLQERGFSVQLTSMGDFKPNTLKKIENLFIVVSTHGDGEPPDSAIPFYEFLHSKRAPQLEGTRYSVLALGDTSYEFFCQTGKDFDKRLAELGAKAIVPRVDCDVDFEEPASAWMSQVVTALTDSAAQEVGPPQTGAAIGSAPSLAVSDAEPAYSRSRPFQAEVLENLNLNGRGSERETRHLEISLEGSNLRYEPGDSLGVYPQNHPQLVDELIEAAGWKADEIVTLGKTGETAPLREALLRQYEITVLTKPLVTQIAELSGNTGLKELIEPEQAEKLKAYLQDRDLLDLIRDFGLKGISAAELTGLLRKIPPRLYSIASSQKAVPDEVHITVRAVRYEANGRNRYGVCSVQLAERLAPGDSLPVFIQHNPNFKLPENPETPIIMIGPGTGVAPFRAFLSEREETGATGKTWLFYGDQRFSTDFLYQVEWQRWLKEGVLTRMDVAFSRDSEQKVYVQHRMLEKSRELYAWLQDGAAVYICGDEKKMAHDVHAALTAILEREGGLSPEEASEYLTRMQQQKRYQRDVY